MFKRLRCKHSWQGSDTTYSYYVSGSVRVAGYFCKKCGKIKLMSEYAKKDLQIERDNYFNNKEQIR